jgi:hypothetical protein
MGRIRIRKEGSGSSKYLTDPEHYWNKATLVQLKHSSQVKEREKENQINFPDSAVAGGGKYYRYVFF